MDKMLVSNANYRRIAGYPAPGGSKHRPGEGSSEPELSFEEKQEMMIRELKGVFCKGRYRSWGLR
jgi:hypothetical protein